MTIQIGEVEALFRYPVKSMRGEALNGAELGWHGLEGDRRLALRRIDDRSGFPWLTATKLPELILFTPVRRTAESLPSHVRTPEGEELALFSHQLAAEVGRRHGTPVEMAPQPGYLRRSECLRDHLSNGRRNCRACWTRPGCSTLPAQHPGFHSAL